MLTVGLLNADMNFQKSMQVPVCDDECAKKYMSKVKDTLMMTKLKVDEVS